MLILRKKNYTSLESMPVSVKPSALTVFPLFGVDALLLYKLSCDLDSDDSSLFAILMISFGISLGISDAIFPSFLFCNLFFS